MSARASIGARVAAPNVEGVQVEIAQEKAASLGRAGRRLEEALTRLAAWDSEATSPAGLSARRGLVAAAAEKLWYYVVQREACGLRDTDRVLRELGVPDEVRARLGGPPDRQQRLEPAAGRTGDAAEEFETSAPTAPLPVRPHHTVANGVSRGTLGR